MNRKRRIGSYKAGIDERAEEQNHSGSVTARICHSLGLRNALTLSGN
jgi:hypothetical protein